MAAPTVTCDWPARAQRLGRTPLGIVTGSLAMGAYETDGVSITDVTKYFVACKNILCDNDSGYMFQFDRTNKKLKVYLPSGTPVIAGEAAHTHAILLDTGASGAEATHTHAVALDGGASAAGSSHTHSVTAAAVDAEAAHTHAVALDSGASAAGSSHNHALSTSTIDGEAAHTHAVALDSGASAAGSSHNHAFTGTAITPIAVDITHNADPGTPGVAVYLHTKDGVHGWFEFVSPTHADGIVRLNATGDYILVFDADGAATDGLAIYFDEDGATADSRIMAITPLALDVLVPTSGGQMIRVAYNAAPDTPGNQVYLDEDAANAYDRLLFISPTTADGTANTDDTYRGLISVCAGANAAEAAHTHAWGTLADVASGVGASHTHALSALALDAEAAHTHAWGTLADAASGVGASHTHGLTGAAIGAEAAHTHAWGTLADAASGAGASHTHGAGTLADAASGVGSSHTHSVTAEAANEVGNAVSLAALTAVKFLAIGII